MSTLPSDCMAARSSFGSMAPDPSVSKRLKASLISSISSSVSLAISGKPTLVFRSCVWPSEEIDWGHVSALNFKYNYFKS